MSFLVVCVWWQTLRPPHVWFPSLPPELVSTHVGIASQEPDGWDENKPGRSLARFCVAVEAGQD